MVWVGLFLALLVLITVGFDTLAGNGVVMVLLLVLVRVLLLLFWISFYLSFIILLGRLLPYLMVLFLCGIVLSSLLLRFLFWVLPVSGHVSGLLTVQDQAAVGAVEVVSSGSGSRRKRFRLNRKTPAHLVGHSVHSRPRVWKRLHCSGDLCFLGVDSKRQRCNQHEGGDSSVFPRTGIG